MNKEQVLELIAQTPKGEERAKLLENPEIRTAVLSSGANVTLYCGDVDTSAKHSKGIFANVFVGLIQRKNRSGKLDGLGALGGLAERTDEREFCFLSDESKKQLVGKKDDVVEKNGQIYLTKDIDIIRKNNVLREMQEELCDIGITDVTINPNKMELIEMPNVKDDNYMTNIWDGKGECFAISPYCHVYKDDEGLIDEIVKRSREQATGEVVEYKKVNLFDALSAYGHIGRGDKALENGRNAEKDYRYPHEYLAAWALASKLLGGDAKSMVNLAVDVQNSCGHRISFERIAKDTKQSIDDVANILGVDDETMFKMEKACEIAFMYKATKDWQM
ncbi:MAG: hypothetical protein IJE43_12650 [Alphaproteobacteria bacterium]|nr:hypothetical protein [Alphaproteobacteria bacterium]